VQAMRTGSELNQATRPFTVEDRPRTWRLLATTFALLAAALVAVVALPWWPAKIAASVLAGLTLVRAFIFYHDHMHGALLHDSPAGKAIMAVVGVWLLTVRSVWKETHNYHHKHNAKLIGSSIGSFPVLTVGMYKALTPAQKLAYRAVRHPVTIALGYLPVFLLGMTISPFQRAPKTHWMAPVALVIHVTLAALAVHFLGWLTGLCLVVLPLVVAHGAGSYLFFAQHNFPDMQLRDRRSWDYTFAALSSSSMFEMSPLMHWFTGNIGYHHVHHLNHRIPFYRLPEAMAALPELQHPGRTSWRLADVAACLRLALWDPEQGRMLTYDEVDRAQPAAHPDAA
jgi:omega-6 fatty acid desaturase (delta-12 desaturase)